MLTKVRFLFGSCLILLTSTFVLSQTQKLSSADALQRYRESLSYLQSVSMKILINVDSFDVDINNERHLSDEEIFPQKIDVVFHRDRHNNRVEWLGKRLVFGLQDNIDLTSSRVVKTIADGNMFVDLQSDSLLDEDNYAARIILLHNYTERQGTLLGSPNRGGPLFGNMYGNNYKSVADSLGQSSDLYIHDKKENINGVACFVLEGTSKYGKVTAWIAPEKGYNAMKWVIEKSSHALFDKTPLSTKWPSVESGKDIFTLKELHEVKVDGRTVFVPKRAHFTHITNFLDGTKNVDEFEYQTSDIQIKPDFEALGAFKIDFPDGIRVFNEDFPNVSYRWENVKPVTVVNQKFLDDLDSQIEQIESDVKTKSAEATDKKNNVPQKEPPAGADTKVDTPKTERELLSESGPSLTVLLIPISLVIIGVIGWLAFRRLRC